MKKNVIVLLLIVIMASCSIGTVPVMAAEIEAGDVVDSGTCGETAAWTLTGTEDNLILTISGSGNMADFSEAGTPWDSRKTEIKSVVVEEGITYIGAYAFFSLNNMTEVSLPDSLRTMGEYAFSNCALLKSIEIPKGIEFTGCTGLSDIVIPDSVRWFGDSAFEKCSSLKSINITDSVTSIGCDAFSGCRFEEVHISSLEHWLNIDARCALQGDYYINGELLTDVVIPENTSNLRPYAFSGCSSLSSISIPNGVGRIQNEAFSDCSNLASINIPDSVTTIEYEAFRSCTGLNDITIPDSVTSIGY